MVIVPADPAAQSVAARDLSGSGSGDHGVSLAALHLPLALLAGLSLAALLLSLRRSMTVRHQYPFMAPENLQRGKSHLSGPDPFLHVSWETSTRPPLPQPYDSCPPVSMAKIIMVRHMYRLPSPSASASATLEKHPGSTPGYAALRPPHVQRLRVPV